jgi:sulfur-carrier protein
VDVTVHLHGVLSRYVDGRRHLEVTVDDAATVDDVLDVLSQRYPAAERRIRDETGAVRRHLNLFVDGEQLRNLGGVTHRLHPGAELLVLPAVSGG